MTASTSTIPGIDQLLEPDDVEIVEATIEAISSTVPAGLSPTQAASAGGRVLSTAVRRPWTVARRAASLGMESARIAMGTSDAEPAPKDRRFTDEAFASNPIYRRLAQGQVALEREVAHLIDDLGLDEKSQLRAELLADIATSTVAPTNTLVGNPAALRRARETNGRSLRDGLRHALHDVKDNGAMPSMVDTRPFTPGETVAATPGAVVFRNAVIELIRYTPTTEQVHERPVMIIPPQINKYYVLDLAPQRSLVEHLVGRGQQVFLVSWRNPGPEHRDWNLDTYLAALLGAMDATLELTGSDDLNLLGVCAGGITQAALLGHLAATDDERVRSASFLVTVLDWTTPSTIGTFVSGPVVSAARRASRRSGMLDGEALGKMFAWLRPNDLVWNYWVNNYLMGKNPPAFDVLSWNVDSTNLPAGLHHDFLSIAEGNRLAEPGSVVALDTPVDLSTVTCDAYVVGAETDHITPWRACFETVNLLGGRTEFVLSSQGHIQALVNPSGNPKGRYRTGPLLEADRDVVDVDEWLDDTEEHQGSWWDHWAGWLGERSGDLVDAPIELGTEDHPVITAAPGTYVTA